MDSIKISNYLRNLNKQNNRGVGISCEKEVGWSRQKVAAHKRLRCTNVSANEKKLFQKRKAFEGLESANNSFDNGNLADGSGFDDEEKQEADRLLASFFYQAVFLIKTTRAKPLS